MRDQLDASQSEEQFGFRNGRSTAVALLILEHVVSKGIEWSAPIWVVSIDLKKAFDIDGPMIMEKYMKYMEEAGHKWPYRYKFKQLGS